MSDVSRGAVYVVREWCAYEDNIVGATRTLAEADVLILADVAQERARFEEGYARGDWHYQGKGPAHDEALADWLADRAERGHYVISVYVGSEREDYYFRSRADGSPR